ncbi:TPA: hypothetical protein J0A47_004353 [Escherichia coli]|nr:hypothetical protein [Escherichia coli]
MIIAIFVLIPFFSLADPISVSSGSSSDTPVRSCHETQDVAVFSAVNDAICCVPPLPRDRPLTTIKWRFAYSLTVLHFRKIWNTPEIGSPENRHPVI